LSNKGCNVAVEATKKNYFNLGVSIVTQLDKITTLSTRRKHEECGGIGDKFDLIIPPKLPSFCHQKIE
jgi:hypothetical protein